MHEFSTLGMRYSPDFTGGTFTERKEKPRFVIRPFEERDYPTAVALLNDNYDTTYAPLLPENVVKGFKDANTVEGLQDAITNNQEHERRDAFVATDLNGQVVGFLLTSYTPYPRRYPHGEIQIRRIHASSKVPNQGLGKQLIGFAEDWGRRVRVKEVFALASGTSRPFFELQGYKGLTTLNHMPKRDTSALVFAARKELTPVTQIYETPTHMIYAGNNPFKLEYLRSIVKDHQPSVVVEPASTEENPTEDVFEAAKSKAYAAQYSLHGQNLHPVIVAGDIRTDLVAADYRRSEKYYLVNQGKPKGTTENEALETVRGNFQTLLNTAQLTGKAAPYIVRSVTYIRDSYNAHNDSFSEHDISVWLTQEGLQKLSTHQGIQEYRAEVFNRYGVDILDMAAGFALPVFLDRGYVAALNGHPLETLPHREEFVKDALHTVVVGIHEKEVKRRLGITS